MVIIICFKFVGPMVPGMMVSTKKVKNMDRALTHGVMVLSMSDYGVTIRLVVMGPTLG
jgi:hypothetical protein